VSIPDIRRRSGSLLLALAAGHIVLISAQVNTRSGVPVLQAFVFGIFAEVQRGTASVVGGVGRTWNDYAALRSVHADNLALERQVRELQVSIQRERALAGEAESLRRLLELRDRSQVPTRAAEIIGTSPAADFRSVTIDRGTSDGVRADMAVISPAGAVGRVVMPSRHAAKVQLLTDRNAAVAVMVGATRAQAIAMGTGEALLRLEYLSGSASVSKGDAVVTSGIDGIYPEGFVVGRVEEIDRSGGLFRAVRIRPAVEFSALEHVLVVLSAPDSAAGQPRGSVGASPTGKRP
jgi:rod shape-determining protein MreC